MKKKIYRTVIRFEVLSETPIPDSMTIGEIERECDEGSYSGHFLNNQVQNSILVGKTAANALKRQGSDPEFFNMDSEGNILDSELN